MASNNENKPHFERIPFAEWKQIGWYVNWLQNQLEEIGLKLAGDPASTDEERKTGEFYLQASMHILDLKSIFSREVSRQYLRWKFNPNYCPAGEERTQQEILSVFWHPAATTTRA